MARESRKWNLSIGLYTQSIDDIPKIIIELATTILILGAGTEQSIEDMTDVSASMARAVMPWRTWASPALLVPIWWAYSAPARGSRNWCSV